MSELEKEQYATGSFKSITTPVQLNKYDLYVDGIILSGDSSIYNHYHIMSQACENDVIYIWINSDGGSLDVANTYVQHMRRCNAQIVAVVGFNCASAATYIALNADAWELSSLSTFLVHGFSYGNYGKAPDVHDSTLFNTKLNGQFIRETYQGLLTEEEIVDVLRGRDILLDSEQLAERLPKYLEYKETKMQVQEFETEVASLQAMADALESTTTKKPRRKPKQKEQ